MSAVPKTRDGFCRLSCVFALAPTLMMIAGIVLYAQYGSILLVQGDNGVSRLFVGEAERMAKAGKADQALALYDRAFQAGFGHPPDKSRALTLKGMLLWRQGKVRETAEVLSAAVSGSAPNFDGASMLVEALLHLKRLDEAQSVVRRWRTAAKAAAPPEREAEMLCAAGRVAEERGDLAGAREAYTQSAALVPGGVAEYRLGLLCAEAGRTAAAREHLERFLAGGASGYEARKAGEAYRSLGCLPLTNE